MSFIRILLGFVRKGTSNNFLLKYEYFFEMIMNFILENSVSIFLVMSRVELL